MRGIRAPQVSCILGCIVLLSVQYASAQTEVSADELNSGIGWESTLFAGSGVPAFRDDVGKEAHFGFMQQTKWLVGIDIDPTASFALVADQYNLRVRMINLTTAQVSTLIKLDESADFETVLGWSRANSLKGISISRDGTRAVVANSYNATTKLNNDQQILWINTQTGTTTVVRNLTDDLGDDIMPWAVAMNGNSEVYCSNNALSIVKVDLETGKGEHLAGKTGIGSTTKGFADGVGTNAFFEFPMGLALDRADPPQYLYMTDQLAVIRRLDLNSRTVSTIAGPRPGDPLSSEGQVLRGYVDSETAGARDARFSFPAGLAVMPRAAGAALSAGTRIVVADAGNHAIRMLTLDSSVPPIVVKVETLTGGPFNGYQNGFPELAKFFGPSDVAMFPSGLRMLVTEQENNVVREVSLNCRGYSYLCGDQCCDCDRAPCPAGEFREACVRAPDDGVCLTCQDPIPAFAFHVDNTPDCSFECQSGFSLTSTPGGQSECVDPNADTEPPSPDHPSFMDNVWVPVAIVLTFVGLAILCLCAWRFLRMPLIEPAAAEAVSREYAGGKVTADAIWYPTSPAPPAAPPQQSMPPFSPPQQSMPPYSPPQQSMPPMMAPQMVPMTPQMPPMSPQLQAQPGLYASQVSMPGVAPSVAPTQTSRPGIVLAT